MKLEKMRSRKKIIVDGRIFRWKKIRVKGNVWLRKKINK